MKRKIINSLILKLSVMVILIESIVLAIIGGYYHQRFEAEIDKRLEAQIRIPGILMNRQLLRYESISDRDMISELVGEELVDAMVIGADHRIFYALEPANEGKHIADISGFDPEWLDPPPSTPVTFSLPSHDHVFLASITPLRAYNGAEPFFFVYLKVNSSRSEAQKSAMSWLFVLGSAFCLLCTSAGMIVSLRTIITAPLHELEENARQIAQGHLHQAIPIERQDELGRLAHSFLHMRDAIRQKIAELQELNRTLEQKVEERTEALQENLARLEQEITDRKRAEESLRESKSLLDSTGRMAHVGGWELDAETLQVHWTEETYRIHEVPLRYNPPVQEAINFFHHADRDRLSQAIQRALNNGEPYDLELRFITARGRHLWTRTICRPQIVNGKTVKLLGTFQDITDRKQAEEQIKTALREKEVLLREIHHRVKNNLMVVTSLIEMQFEQTTHPEALNLFRDLHNRVMAMSMVHEDLYQSKNLAQIEFGAYLERLVINIRRGFAKTSAAIKIDAHDIFLDVQQAIPCGLIVAELVTNAFKYAFRPERTPKFPSWEGQGVGKNRSEQHEMAEPTPNPSQEADRGRYVAAQPPDSPPGRGQGWITVGGGMLPSRAHPCPSQEGNTIRVEMRKEGDACILIVSDNGVGLPPGFDIQTSQTLGMSLVRSWAVHQLRGTLEVDVQKGTKFIMTFQENRPE